MNNKLAAFLALKGIADQDTINLLKEWGMVCVNETAEIAKHHCDGDMDTEGTIANSKNWLDL